MTICSPIEDLVLRFDEVQCSAEGFDGPHTFLHEHAGRLVIPGIGDQVVEVGQFKAMYLDIDGALIEGENPFHVFDVMSTTADFWPLFREDKEWGVVVRPNVARVVGGTDSLFALNLLILDRLEILPAYRGHGIGLLALRALIHRLRAGAGLVALKAFPLQFEAAFRDGQPDAKAAGMELASFVTNERTATAALKRYYGRLGFRRIPGTEFMAMAGNQRLPEHEALLRKARTKASSAELGTAQLAT